MHLINNDKQSFRGKITCFVKKNRALLMIEIRMYREYFTKFLGN